jgi:hypothetical protein
MVGERIGVGLVGRKGGEVVALKRAQIKESIITPGGAP